MKLLLPTCLGLAAVANAWTGDNCKRFADIYTDGADLINRMWGSMVEVNPCVGSVWAALHSSALVPPQGTCGGSGQLGTPRKRPAHWDPNHCLGCSS